MVIKGYLCNMYNTKIMKTFLITFSPTGTSRKVGEAIARGIDPECIVYDYMKGRGAITVPAGAVAVVSVPVYGGHVAPPASEWIKNISGEGAMAVATVVYGNRDYENALVELGDMLRARGFRISGGATFVGEHSYSTARFPIAAGRPDCCDLEQALWFGAALKEKMLRGSVDDIDLSTIVHTENPAAATARFYEGVMKIRSSGTVPRTPVVDEAGCVHCGRCVAVCPMGAITEGNECHTDAGRCIDCCACVKACATGARTYDTPFAPLLSECFGEQKPNHTIL